MLSMQRDECTYAVQRPAVLSCPGAPVAAAGMIGKDLDLKRGGNGRYQKTAAYGHFGRDEPDFTWEQVRKLE